MIAWLNPVALVGLLGVLGPILIHLLRQPRAVHVPFPSLRFVQPSRTVAARMRRISEPWLLVLRVLIVGAAALALAQPVLLTSARLAAWNARTARAVVLDTSRSMEAPAVAAPARAAADAEAGAAFVSTLVEGDDLSATVARAVAWLHAAPPARREVVVISDFQVGSLSGAVPTVVPESFGLRLVPVGVPATGLTFTGMTRFGSGARQDVRLTMDATEVTWNEADASRAGLRFLPEQVAGTDPLVRAVTAAGAPAGSVEQPIAIAFATADVPAAMPIEAGWMLNTAVLMARDAELLRAAAASDAPTQWTGDDRWLEMARTRDGRPAVRAAAAGVELIVQVAAAPGDYLSAAALRSALHARHGSVSSAFAGEEVVRLSAADLSALNREAQDVSREAVLRVERSDARWVWLAVLLLLALETWMRRPRAIGQAEAARAA
jgi:hypothetical protein